MTSPRVESTLLVLVGNEDPVPKPQLFAEHA